MSIRRILLKVWRPKTVLGYGGVAVPETEQNRVSGASDRLATRDILLAWLDPRIRYAR